MRILTFQEEWSISGGETKAKEEIEPRLVVSVCVGGVSVGTFSGLTTYYFTEATFGWRLGISFVGLYSGFIIGCLIGAGALIASYKFTSLN